MGWGVKGGEVRQSWLAPSVPGRPRRSVCGWWVRRGSRRVKLSYARRKRRRRKEEEAKWTAIWSGGACGM